MTDAIVALLFTDVVGSTALLDRVGDDAFDALRRRHFRALREQVASHGGTEVKSLGDGLMVVLPSAVQAVDCAVAIQRSTPIGEGVAVRVGLHVGEPIRDEDDYFGTPVVVARRLCDRAGPGQILASALVRELVGRRRDFAFGAVGELELKGLSTPVAAFEVGYERGPISALPGALAELAGEPFVGRAAALTEATQALKETFAGGVRIALFAGEPGIGKTRLAAALAAEASSIGATVLYGRADEDNLVPYQPFVEAIGASVSSFDELQLRAMLGGAASDLARLVPDLGRRVPSLVTEASGEPDTERYLMFEAVAAFLISLAERVPVLLVLDDLHWADGATLRLLRHLLRHGGPHRLMIVGTYRDTDLDRAHPLAAVLADLRRESAVSRYLLTGLTETAICELLEQLGDQPLDDQGVALAGSLRRETEGNPFFIREVVRHLVESGVLYQRDGHWVSDFSAGEIGLPEGVREVIGRRLSRLDEATNALLAAGAVLGREFSLTDLAAVADTDVDSALLMLEHAGAAAVVAEVPGAVDRWAFTHALVRQTLVEELSAARRIRLHRRAASAIEARPDIETHLAELARHHAESGDPEGKVASYATRAARNARQALAFEESARLYDLALDALDPSDKRTRAELLVEQTISLWGHGSPEFLRTIGNRALAAAQEVGIPELLADAAVAAVGPAEAGLHDEVRRAALIAASQRLSPSPSPRRARVLARLASASLVPVEGFPASADDSLRYAAEATQLARDDGDPELIAEVARSTMFVDGVVAAAGPGKRIAHAHELRERARELQDPVLECVALGWMYGARMSNFETAAAAAALDEFAELATRTRRRMDAYFASAWRVSLLLFKGELDEAARLNAELLQQFGSSDWPAVLQSWGVIEFLLRRWRGGIEDLLPLVEANATDPRTAPQWAPARAYLLAELGRNDEARSEMARLDLTALRNYASASLMFCLVAFTADALGEEAVAREAAEVLAPHEGSSISIGLSSNLGSASHYLAVAFRALGEVDESVRQFRRAIEENSRSRALPWLGESQYEFAKLLRSRGGAEDEAAALLAESLDTCERLGMHRLGASVSALMNA